MLKIAVQYFAIQFGQLGVENKSYRLKPYVEVATIDTVNIIKRMMENVIRNIEVKILIIDSKQVLEMIHRGGDAE